MIKNNFYLLISFCCFLILLSSCEKKKARLKIERFENFVYETQVDGEFVNIRKYSSNGQFFFVLQVDLGNISDQTSVSKAPFSLVSDDRKIRKMVGAVKPYFEDSKFDHPNILCFEGLDSSGFWMRIVKVNNECFILADQI